MVTPAPASTTEKFPVADIDLATETWHARGRPIVLFAHGFGQTRGAWRSAAVALARRGCCCVTFDSRGHGQSGRVANGVYHLEQFVDDLLRLARAQAQPPILVGASMGGLLGMLLAGEVRPSPFAALVLVDITPRWETSGVERILQFMQDTLDGFADYAEAAERIAAYQPQRSVRKTEQQLRPLLRQGEDGRLHWHWDRAMLSAVARDGDRHQARLESAAALIDIPVLLLSGARSDVVSDAVIDEFLQLVPQAQHVQLANATHMLAGDANDAFTSEVERFVYSLAKPAVYSRPGVTQP